MTAATHLLQEPIEFSEFIGLSTPVPLRTDGLADGSYRNAKIQSAMRQVWNRSPQPPSEPEKSYPFPVWSGLLTPKHWHRIGGSIWVFLWLLDRTTTEDNGWGVVLGGKPVKDGEIAGCFGFAREKMVNHRRRLLDGRYIEAKRTPYGYSYRVRNSRKFGIWGKNRRDKTADYLSVRCDEIVHLSGRDVTKSYVRCDEIGGNKEDHAVDHAVKHKYSRANPKPRLHDSAADHRQAEFQTVARIFAQYLGKTGKNPKLYEFTHLRKQKGLSRIRECLGKTGGDLAKAEALMNIAVDNLAASPWHMGENPNKKRYDSWERHLFPSQEKLEWWLEQDPGIGQ